ncbi:hypothetical protein CCP3SC1AL1_2210002 [Gammaproteobacteria bacterium]
MAYKIKLSENMRMQGHKEPKQKFEKWVEAYNLGIQKWGSGSYEANSLGKPVGWDIKKLKEKK